MRNHIPIVPLGVFDGRVKSKTIAEKAELIINAAIPNPRSGCLETTASKDGRGYGIVGCEGRYYRAHVVVWLAANGPKPPHLKVLHSCDNPSCVNLAHLHLGTQAQNAAEMVQRGRQRGKIPQRLRTQDVLEIRRRREAGESQGSIARYYGTRPNVISRILSNHNWGHLGLPPVPHFFCHQKLSDDVRRLKHRRAQGVSQRLLSEEFGIGQAQVSRILTGVRRSNV